MKKILVPCDFSKEAVEAYKFSLQLAERAELEVAVVFMVDLPTFVAGFDVQPFTYDRTFQEELAQNARKQFSEMKSRIGGSSQVSFDVVFDSVLRGTTTLVDRGDIELIVMGTKGASGVQEVFFGSNTEKVVRFSSVPVFAIRRAPDVSKIKTIIFPNKLTLNQTDLIHRLKDLQSFFKAELHLLWINTPGHFEPDVEVEALMQEFVLHYGLSRCQLVIKNDFTEDTGILRYSHEANDAVVAMGTSGRRGLAHMLLGSIAEDVVNHIECPIWTFSTRQAE